MSEAIATTKRQREIMRHALGLNYKKRPFRNHFCTGPGGKDYEMCQQLEEMGLMVSSKSPICPDDVIFVVTPAGKAELHI